MVGQEPNEPHNLRVLLVHRPRYDDWSFPKGKANPGETIEQTAVREVLEETGLRCRILGEISQSRYTYTTGETESVTKVVHYFVMKPEGGQLKTDGDEVDRAEWLDPPDAIARLSYEADVQILRLLLERKELPFHDRLA